MGTRHCIIHERAGYELPGVRVIEALFQESLADPLSHGAMGLTVNDERIQ